ncbi:DNA polymerase III subunit gamma and tau [Nocardia sp. NBC_01329]|uniref:DNA polymerase III subunit gamma and tau n=1 Tax=Nocardia sp. NBC_01329 TaxID=2903594 RepID=UPI002E0D48B3|nr:DNA polymerase III subunit gamma and tau [Nocardia sp. NBC_01329]
MALYRKYRPATFADVVGQEHVTEPLCTALDTGRISHAYLFSGPRGCGKTSSARILARSLNCAQGPTSTPCGTCASCLALAPGGGGNLDVIELDAASHGGVDDTRELRDRAFYAPAESRYRVFIVDEAHMVTTAGFNALLKIVEEPPAHLIFVFATTEPDKVLPTIRSRTHHYPFRLLPPATMRGLLGGICEQEQVTVEEAVYPLVIRAGGGSPRDSLSVLDQLLAGAGSEGVTYPRAVALLGVTDVALIDDAVDALAAADGAALFGTVDRVMEAGHDPRRFAVDLLERLRDLILIRAVPDATERGLVAGPADLLDRMREQAARLGPASLTRYAELLHAGLGEMRGATAPRLLLEVVCSRMLLPAADESDAATLQRLEQLERRVASGVRAVPPAAPASSAPADGPPPEVTAPVRAAASDPSRRRGAEALAALRESRTGRVPEGPTVGESAEAAEPGPMPPAVDRGGRDREIAAAPAGHPEAPAGSVEVESGPAAPQSPVAEVRDDPNAAGAAAPMGPPRDAVSPQPNAAPPRPAEPTATAPTGSAGPEHPGGPVDESVSAENSAEPPASDSAAASEATSGAEPTGPDTDSAPADPELLAAVEAAWPEIKVKVKDFGPTIGAMLTSGASVAGVEDGEIVLAHHAALVQRLSQPQPLSAVRSAVTAVLGREHPVRWVVTGQQVSRGPGGRERGGRRSGDTESGESEGGRRGGPRRPAPSRSGGEPDDAGEAPAGSAQDGGAGGSDNDARPGAGAGGRAGDPGRRPPRFSRPSQAKAAGAAAANPYDDIPPPDYPDLPDDPGPGDHGYAPNSVPPSTPEEEREMLAESAQPVAPGDRRDPDDVALRLLASELGATPLNG